MPRTSFDRDSMARWYASEHLRADPGVRKILYLPKNAPEREIRLLELNELLADRTDTSLEPVDFGVDTGSDNEHKLYVLDITRSQWDSISQSSLALPSDWTLEDAKVYGGEE